MRDGCSAAPVGHVPRAPVVQRDGTPKTVPDAACAAGFLPAPAAPLDGTPKPVKADRCALPRDRRVRFAESDVDGECEAAPLPRTPSLAFSAPRWRPGRKQAHRAAENTDCLRSCFAEWFVAVHSVEFYTRQMRTGAASRDTTATEEVSSPEVSAPTVHALRKQTPLATVLPGTHYAAFLSGSQRRHREPREGPWNPHRHVGSSERPLSDPGYFWGRSSPLPPPSWGRGLGGLFCTCNSVYGSIDLTLEKVVKKVIFCTAILYMALSIWRLSRFCRFCRP